jgi:hypothetical protein
MFKFKDNFSLKVAFFRLNFQQMFRRIAFASVFCSFQTFGKFVGFGWLAVTTSAMRPWEEMLIACGFNLSLATSSLGF